MIVTELFSKVPLFEGVSPENRAALARAATLRTYRRGETIVQQGQPGDAAFALMRAAALAPSAVPARFWLVQAYRGVGRADLAREELEVLRRLDPRAAEGLSVR